MLDRNDHCDPTTVLLISQSAELRRLTSETFGDSADVYDVTDQAAARSFLDGRSPYTDAPVASLVLLDSGDGADAIGFLEAVADTPARARIPIIVLGAQRQSSDRRELTTECRSTAPSRADIRRYYDRHANAYVPLPADREAIADVLAELAAFWLATVRLPNRDDRIS